MTIDRFLITVLVLLLFLIGCTGSKSNTQTELEITTEPTVVEPKQIGDIQYGISSYYAEKFHGNRTANGEIYDMYGISGAHQTLPLNSLVKVTNLENNKELIIKINDRGPFVKNRIFDCSYGAAIKLGFVNQGTAIVKVEVIEIGDNIYRLE